MRPCTLICIEYSLPLFYNAGQVAAPFEPNGTGSRASGFRPFSCDDVESA